MIALLNQPGVIALLVTCVPGPGGLGALLIVLRLGFGRGLEAEAVHEPAGVVLIAIADEPATWDTPEYAISEQGVRVHLGAEPFFSKAAPERLTVAPD